MTDELTDPLPDTPGEGRAAAEEFLAAIDGRAGSEVFLAEADLTALMDSAEPGSDQFEHLSACLDLRRALIASAGQEAFDLAATRHRLAAEIALIRTAADVTTSAAPAEPGQASTRAEPSPATDAGGQAFRRVLLDRADELTERLDALDDPEIITDSPEGIIP